MKSLLREVSSDTSGRGLEVSNNRTYPQGSIPRGLEHLLAREVHLCPDSDACLSVASSWLTDCLTTHETCRRAFQEDKPLPTRVIDVGSNGKESKVRLVISDGACGSWAALSYCWGGDSTFILKTTRLKDMLNGIPIEAFPATLRDAVMVTRSLGIRYIWIDALCILQDSAEDWAAEAARMEYVYRGAKVTISAISSPGSGHGMLRKRALPSLQCQLACKTKESDVPVPLFLRSGSALWDVSMKTSPLNTRGWTLQEALLSPRALSYGSQQMVWECLERQIDEGGRPVAPGEKYRDKKFIQELLTSQSNARKQSAFRKAVSLSSYVTDTWQKQFERPYDRWFDIVTEYTSRRLTVATDILPALSGLAKAFQNLVADQYCAGLWANDLLRGLMWRRQPPKPADFEKVVAQPKPQDYRVPSWSWPSIHGRRVTYLYPPTDDYSNLEERAKIVDVGTTPRLEDPFGQTRDGYLTIEGAYRSIIDPYATMENDPYPDASALEVNLREAYANVFDFSSEFKQQHQEHESQEFGVLLLAKSHIKTRRETSESKRWTRFPAAVLLVVESTGARENEYRRIGLHMMRVTGSSSDDMIGQLFFDELKKEKWKQKKMRLV